MLTAVWPLGNYDLRLQLSYPTEVPAHSPQTTASDDAEDWLSFLNSGRPLAFIVPKGSGGRQAQRQVPCIVALISPRKSLESSDSDPLPRGSYQKSLYSSVAALGPTERGPPPCLT